MSQPPIYDGQPLEPEDKRLVDLMGDLEKGQIDFIEQAGKRIIELVTALLGVLFTVMALGDKFPPPYLKGNDPGKLLAVLALIFYLAAMALAMRVVQPRDYELYRHNISGMREEFHKLLRNKSSSLELAGLVFWLASAFLALLIISIIFSA